jgi:hypothetical protein
MNLLELASGFATEGTPQRVEPLGAGNVNATYVVEVAGGRRYVLQRLNTAVFERPDLVMANLDTVVRHCRQRLTLTPPQQTVLPGRCRVRCRCGPPRPSSMRRAICCAMAMGPGA